MDREKLIQHLEQRYYSRREMLSRIPLGMQPDALWQQLQDRRRSRSTTLPLTSCRGIPYWYVTTEKMVAASEKIIETLYENETDIDPYTDLIPVSTLEEVFYTSYVEGSQITMQAAMEFLTSENPPRDIEEQMITNNRIAGSFASSNLFRKIDADLLQQLSSILTDGMDNGGDNFRTEDISDFSPVNGELFEFPAPRDIPYRTEEITQFLSSPQIHPLIKSAVVQAWAIVVRPFPEGNDRLGRILSNMILLRAGYTFFSDISLSALIARKGYSYSEAVKNILREENGGDLTYFLEYYMELLSRAIDERALRKKKREEENLQAEIELARTALPPVIQPGALSPHPSPQKTSDPPQDTVITDPPSAETATVDVEAAMETPENSSVSTEVSTPMERLSKYTDHPETITGQFAFFIISQIDKGKMIFSVTDATKELQVIPQQLSKSIRFMKEIGILSTSWKDKNQTYYRITLDPEDELKQSKKNLLLAEKQGIDPEALQLIQELLDSKRSAKDRRLGCMLAFFLPRGEISVEDYDIHGEKAKWASDMAFAQQLGLVEKTSNDNYTILKQLKPGLPTLNKNQKKFITEMYECFGDNAFSKEMVVATLDYSGSHVFAYLHQFTLLRILDCHKEGVNKYQFLVNPQEHPQLFEIAA